MRAHWMSMALSAALLMGCGNGSGEAPVSAAASPAAPQFSASLLPPSDQRLPAAAALSLDDMPPEGAALPSTDSPP
jgi:hypothetical protein